MTAVVEQKPRPEHKVTYETLSALGNETRWDVLVTLEQKGPMSFSDLSKTLKVDGPILVHHLRKLLAAGLIEKKVSLDPYSSSYRIYEVSTLGELILRGLKVSESRHS